MQEVCFRGFSACKLAFHILCGSGKKVKNQLQTLLHIVNLRAVLVFSVMDTRLAATAQNVGD